MDSDVSHFHLTKENSNPPVGADQSPCKMQYKNSLDENLLNGQGSSKILAFKTKAPAPSDGTVAGGSHSVLYSQSTTAATAPASRKRVTRTIPSAPERILDAPEFVDDYYLNLLDWSQSNVLSIALGSSVYLLNCNTKAITKLLTLEDPDNYVTSVSWMQDRDTLAVGTNLNQVQMWDVERGTQLREMVSHSARVGALSWNQHILSSGSRDSQIHHHDVRQRDHHVATLAGHTQEVCGLKWSPDGTQLASGGNDNLLNVWNGDSFDAPRYTFSAHNAAVKALAWCPWQSHTLASGGGTADRTLKIWNTRTGAMLNSIDTRSQVCSILWSKTHKELISSHGFSQNQLIVWKYPSMVQVGELTGHTSRVLHMAMSPDGKTVVSAAGDETLRFWNVFSPSEKAGGSSVSGMGAYKKASGRSMLSSSTISIR